MQLPPSDHIIWKVALVAILAITMISLMNSKVIYQSGIQPEDVKFILSILGTVVSFYCGKAGLLTLNNPSKPE